MRRALLHLGMNKTGSTTIQIALGRFETDSLVWLRDERFTQTQMMCLPFRRPVPEVLWTVQGEAARKTEQTEARAALDRAMLATSKDVLVSSEFLSDLRNPEQVANLVDALRAHVDTVTALVYLRDAPGYLVSVYQQSLKLHLPKRGINGLWPNYQKRITPWDTVLGAENVAVRAFDRSCFPDGSLMLDFAQWAGIDQSVLPPAANANTSLSAEAVGLLYAYRLSVPAMAADPRCRRAEAWMIHLLQSFGARRLAFSRRMLRRLMADRAEDLSWAEARMGRPFPVSGPRPGRVAIPRLEALDDLAVETLPSFLTWLHNTHPKIAAAVQPAGPAQVIAAIVDYMQATRN